MRNLFYIILITILLFASPGCDDEGTNPGLAKYEIQPLRIGSTYYYKDSTMTSTGWMIDSLRIHIPGKGTVTGEVNSQGVHFWDEYRNGILERRKFLNLESDGLFQYAEITGSDTLFIRKMLARYPVEVGDSFTESRYNYNPDSGEYEFEDELVWFCISTDFSVTIETGQTLFCHVFRAQPQQREEMFLFYAINVGYTGLRILRDSILHFEQKLTSYQLTE